MPSLNNRMRRSPPIEQPAIEKVSVLSLGVWKQLRERERLMENLQIVPVQQSVVQPQYVEMKVPLYSYGCEKKMKKALLCLKGIYSVQVDHGTQKVTVWGICNRDAVLATVQRKRRGARFWDDQVPDVEAAAGDVDAEVKDEASCSELAQAAAPPSRGLIRAGKWAFYRRFKLRRPWKSLLPLAMALSH